MVKCRGNLYSADSDAPGRVGTMPPGAGRYEVIDELDARLIELLAAEPRAGILEASRRLGVARGTVQARLHRLPSRAVITGYRPDVHPAALGYAVSAFATVVISQARRPYPRPA